MHFKQQFITLNDDNVELNDAKKLYLQSAITHHVKQLQNIDDMYASLFEA